MGIRPGAPGEGRPGLVRIRSHVGVKRTRPAWQGFCPPALAPLPRQPLAHLAQQPAFEVGATAARVRDEAPRIWRRWPSQHLLLRSGQGTRRRPRSSGGRGRGGSTRERARGQEARGGLHADGASQRGPGLFWVPPGPGLAWRCLVLLLCARAGGSPAFLSMNAGPLPGVSSSRTPPLPGGESRRSHASFQALHHPEAPPLIPKISRPRLLC